MISETLFKSKIKVINVGLKSFADDLLSQRVETVHVDWHPPAGGNKKIQALLEKIEKWQNSLQKGETL